MMKKHLAGLRIAILSAGVIASVPVLTLHAADPQEEMIIAVIGPHSQIGRHLRKETSSKKLK